MEVSKLEELSARLHRLREQLNETTLRSDLPLDNSHQVVQAAIQCEFMLPAPLTVATLSDTVDKKIDNVNLLLERARKHADLPVAAQVAAEQEYTATEEDMALKKEEDAHNGSAVQR